MILRDEPPPANGSGLAMRVGEDITPGRADFFADT
jgi:hypothetical protein